MLVSDLFSLSLHNLFLHKIRSLLTSLGIIFGVGSVIAMLAISAGAKKAALSQIEALGIDNIIVYTKSGNTSEVGADESARVLEYGLTGIDLVNIYKMENINRVTTARLLRAKILRGTDPVDVELFWVSPEILEDVNGQMVSGRWLSAPDYENAASVCVIGRNVKRKMFGMGERSVVGKSIVVAGGVFRIVGTFENNADSNLEGFGDLNDTIFIPSSTGLSVFTEYNRVGNQNSSVTHHVEYDVFIVKVLDLNAIDHTARRIGALLGETHDINDWGISVPLNLLRKKEATQNIFTVVMASIAGISLIVGGIGIMNIMLANVYERRKEIGTRRAMGATKADILRQFLIETVFLTIMGGLLGIGLGCGIAVAVTSLSGMPSEISLISMVGSMGISGVIGVVFGTYPAWQAANQNPIEALKAE
jgi:putative ABC transport system permease protein